MRKKYLESKDFFCIRFSDKIFLTIALNTIYVLFTSWSNDTFMIVSKKIKNRKRKTKSAIIVQIYGTIISNLIFASIRF